MDKKFKQNLQLIAFGVILFVVLIYYKEVLGVVKHFWSMFLPITTGLVIALVMNVPASKLFKWLTSICQKFKWKISERILHVISIVLTLIALLLIVFFIAYLVIPEIVTSLTNLFTTLSVNIPKWIQMLEESEFDTSFITDYLSKMDFSQWNTILSNNIGNMIGSVSTTVLNSLSNLFSFSISMTIAIYALLDKKKLGKKAKEVLYAVFNKDIADEIKRICLLVNKSVSNFFGGQSTEALILGVFMAAAFSLFGLPYGSLVGLLAAVGSFIPCIGATMANIIGSFLIFLVQPKATILSIIVYQVVQFIENQFIYPKVVGKAVGISPLLTLTAVIVGGKMFGVLGIVFSLPVTAVLVTLIDEYIGKRLKKKNIQIEDVPLDDK